MKPTCWHTNKRGCQFDSKQTLLYIKLSFSSPNLVKNVLEVILCKPSRNALWSVGASTTRKLFDWFD
ncbi:unnamed protein product [Arctia plantaginis]|uniref:Uncharacterized protein n=1 Tax=Arctia plantaginis TaxID=874455 RepID=A0A8S0Z310_ARCPL|nr:unnamed protein product [Arctia plantaginis]CAB3225978.1 unnamed protein product [Arctia plantaginis]